MEPFPITRGEYNKLVQKRSPPSPKAQNLVWAFCTGGLICVLGQLITALYQALGAGEEDAATWTTVTLIFLSALLTGLRIYDRLARHAGAGTLVPVTGFANAVVSPAMEFKAEGFVTGMAAKMFQIAGPVLVFGIGASILYGIILCWLG